MLGTRVLQYPAAALELEVWLYWDECRSLMQQKLRERQTGGFEERERQDIAGRQGRTDITRCKTGEKERWAVRQTCGQGETDRWDAGRRMKRSPSDRQSRDRETDRKFDKWSERQMGRQTAVIKVCLCGCVPESDALWDL